MIDLARTVTTLRLDLGIAWDTDGDRIGVVDHRGYRYEADWLVALLARPLLERRPGAPILLDAKASRSAIEDVAAHGGEPSIAPTGYPRFRRQMREQGIAFGGETSGHIMFGPRLPRSRALPLARRRRLRRVRAADLARPLRTVARGGCVKHPPAPCVPRAEAALPRCRQGSRGRRDRRPLCRASRSRSQRRRADRLPRRMGPCAPVQHRPRAEPPLRSRFRAMPTREYPSSCIAALEAHPEVGERERIADPPSIGPQPLA